MSKNFVYLTVSVAVAILVSLTGVNIFYAVAFMFLGIIAGIAMEIE